MNEFQQQITDQNHCYSYQLHDTTVTPRKLLKRTNLTKCPSDHEEKTKETHSWFH